MLIGVISDTHDDISAINKAVEFFNLRKADLVLHCGDFSSVYAAQEFLKLNCGFRAVFGNNDFDRAELSNIININPAPFAFKVQDKSFLMSHKSVFPAKKFDFVLSGHTHIAKIENINGTIFLNPGEASGRRYGRMTVALIDLEKRTCEIFDLDLEV